MPIFDKTKSRIKMVGLIPGKENNIVWYSIINKDKKDVSNIINGMLNRFRKNESFNRVLKIQFYDVQTNTLIAEYSK